MHSCPITLEEVADDEVLYSAAGLRSLHSRLTHLQSVALGQKELLNEAVQRADKMSIQGIQPKLSAVLKLADGVFEIVDSGGQFILKPNPHLWEEVPANEALTMTLARHAGIEVPPHGLLQAGDGSWVYVIRRFDREGKGRKLHMEDFAQLSGASRETKYDSSLEKVAALVEQYCSFPAIEKAVLARRLLFCFLTGNEDMHLKNFSLIVREDTVRLAPAYDLLNSTLVLGKSAIEESALSLRGRKRKLNRGDWLDYFCGERLALPKAVIEKILNDLRGAVPLWRDLIGRSYLSLARRERYLEILEERQRRLFPETA